MVWAVLAVKLNPPMSMIRWWFFEHLHPELVSTVTAVRRVRAVSHAKGAVGVASYSYQWDQTPGGYAITARRMLASAV